MDEHCTGMCSNNFHSSKSLKQERGGGNTLLYKALPPISDSACHLPDGTRIAEALDGSICAADFANGSRVIRTAEGILVKDRFSDIWVGRNGELFRTD